MSEIISDKKKKEKSVPLILENLDVNADFDLLNNDLKNNSDGIDDILSAVEMPTTVLQNSSVSKLTNYLSSKLSEQVFSNSISNDKQLF
jgi:hypothetical protein